jgi:N-acyl-D-aspartate/D-glutamate deacylase
MAPNLTVRAWNPHDGNPGSPEHVLGIPVDRLLAKRPDAPGALVALRDRRLALTGQVAAIGRHRMLRTYVRGRARTKDDRAYRAWLAEVAEVLERMLPESRSR